MFLHRSPVDDSSWRNTKSRTDRRKQKQETIEQGVNFDCRASVALQKIGQSIQTHVGGMNKAGIFAAVSADALVNITALTKYRKST